MAENFIIPKEWNKYITNNNNKIKTYENIVDIFDDVQIYFGIFNLESIKSLLENYNLKNKVANIENIFTDVLAQIKDNKHRIIEIQLENYYLNNKLVIIYSEKINENYSTIRNSINYILEKYKNYRKIMLNSSGEYENQFLYGFMHIYISNEIFKNMYPIINPKIRKNTIGKYRILEYNIN